MFCIRIDPVHLTVVSPPQPNSKARRECIQSSARIGEVIEALTAELILAGHSQKEAYLDTGKRGLLGPVCCDESIPDPSALDPAVLAAEHVEWQQFLAWVPQPYQILLTLAAQGHTIAEIARRTGWHPDRIRCIIKEFVGSWHKRNVA